MGARVGERARLNKQRNRFALLSDMYVGLLLREKERVGGGGSHRRKRQP